MDDPVFVPAAGLLSGLDGEHDQFENDADRALIPKAVKPPGPGAIRDPQEATMTTNFDFRAFCDAVAYPAKLVLGTLETRECSVRPTLVLRWQRGKDGRLESRWQRDE